MYILLIKKMERCENPADYIGLWPLFFVVADMVGGGIVALPTAIVRCSFYLGVAILGSMAIMATISAIFLGRCWTILLNRYPEYRIHCRKPYAEIAYRAMGPLMKVIVTIVITISQFGASTSFLLLIGKNISDAIHVFFQIDLGPV